MTTNLKNAATEWKERHIGKLRDSAFEKIMQAGYAEEALAELGSIRAKAEETREAKRRELEPLKNKHERDAREKRKELEGEIQNLEAGIQNYMEQEMKGRRAVQQLRAEASELILRTEYIEKNFPEPLLTEQLKRGEKKKA